MKRLLVIGAGGHGKVVADTAEETRQWKEICFLDDVITKGYPYKVIGTIKQLPIVAKEFTEIIVAVGDNKRREQLLSWISDLGCSIATIIHPKTFVSKYAEVAKGAVVFAQVAINAATKIGFGSIINTGAIIEHDCMLESCVHVSPNAVLAGGVSIKKCSWIGAGSSIIEKTNIGENTIIGAGSVVINDIPDNVVAAGNPAKIIKKNVN